MFFVFKDYYFFFQQPAVAILIRVTCLLEEGGCNSKRPEDRKVKKLLSNVCFKTSIYDICSNNEMPVFS
jgi:hypothetical protein